MPLRRNFIAPKSLQNLSEVQAAFVRLQEVLDRNFLSPYQLQVATGQLSLLSPSFQRVSPPSSGQTATLPKASPDNAGDRIVVNIEHPLGLLTVFAAPGDTLNGLSGQSFSVAGAVEFFSNGVDSWTSTSQLPGPPGLPGTTGASGSNGTTALGLVLPADDDGPAWLIGPPGLTGATGAQGPVGPSAPFPIDDDGFTVPPVPFQWSDVLGAGNHSGPNNGFVDVGQFINFGLAGPTTSNPQIRSGDATFRIRGGNNVAVLADNGAATLISTAGGQAAVQAQGATQPVLLSSVSGPANIEGATQLALRTGGSPADRVVIGSTGEWTTPAGSSGQVWTHQGAGTPPIWATPAGASTQQLPPPALAFPVDADELRPGCLSAPLGWSAVLAASRNSGPNNPKIDVGQFLEFGTGTVPVLGDIRSASGFTIIAGGGNLDLAGNNTATLRNSLATCEVITVDDGALTGVRLLAPAGRGVRVEAPVGLIVQQSSGSATGGMVGIGESGSTPASLGAGFGSFWAKNTIGTTPQFTDDEAAIWSLGYGLVSVITSNVTITASTAQTIASFAVPANTWNVGTTYDFYAHVTYVHTATATTNPSFQIQSNGVVAATVTITTPATAGTYLYLVQGSLTCRTTGAGGTLIASIHATPSGAAAAFAAQAWGSTTTATIALNTTAGATIQVTGHLAAVLAGNTLTIPNAYIRRMK